MLKITRTSK